MPEVDSLPEISAEQQMGGLLRAFFEAAADGALAAAADGALAAVPLPALPSPEGTPVALAPAGAPEGAPAHAGAAPMRCFQYTAPAMAAVLPVPQSPRGLKALTKNKFFEMLAQITGLKCCVCKKVVAAIHELSVSELGHGASVIIPQLVTLKPEVSDAKQATTMKVCGVERKVAAKPRFMKVKAKPSKTLKTTLKNYSQYRFAESTTSSSSASD